MKASLTLLLALFLFPTLAVSSPDLSNYQLVFGDEFNANQLDTNNWGSSHIWGPYVQINQEKQYYVDKLGGDAGHAYDPFVLNGSTLKIRAIPTTSALKASPQPNQNDDYWNQNPEFQYSADYDPNDREYLSGILSSVDKFEFTHGYAEARIKLPEGQGLWSAFWLLTTKYVEDAPEIDIMEALGHNTDTVHHTMHYFDTANNWQLISTPTYDTTGVDYTADFHVYGLAWSPKKITWYVDGVAVKTLTDQDFKIPTQSMYVLLNVATGGTWPGDPDNTTSFPADMEVDYVRVYEQQPVNTITPAVLNSDYQIMFEDNFNGTSLNDQKWNTNYLWGPYFPINNEHQIYIDKHGRHSQSNIQPFTVANGVLSIEAKALAASDVPDQPPINDPEWQEYSSHQYNSNYNQSGGWTPTYSSGLITSYDKFKFVNGYVEARIKLPAGGGLWPAFWLLNGYYVGPQPEIDIIELDGAHTNVGHHSYHYLNSVGELQSSAELSSTGTDNLTDDFHVYGVQWEAGLIKWYVDGNIVRTLQGPEVSTQLMYILLNLAVGGNFVGEIDASVFPTTMDIDYVRAYQRKDHIETSTRTCYGSAVTVDLNIPGSVPTTGDDVIIGTAGDDVINARGGNDIVCGLAGADTINGETGNDIVYGGGGDDVITGGAGVDTLYGQSGDDDIQGNNDSDEIFGGSGADTLYGNNGNDVISGQGGKDFLYGGEGYDYLYGRSDVDYIYTGHGETETSVDGGFVQGGGGNDWIYGTAQDDIVYGNSGLDHIYGYGGGDELYGGPGADHIHGGDGDDLMYGHSQRDFMYGGGGSDTIYGGEGSDDLHGDGLESEPSMEGFDTCDGQGPVSQIDTAHACEDEISIP